MANPADPQATVVQWPAIIAGAIAAAGIAFALHAFAAGIGLSVYSGAPTWRDSSAAYWFLTGVYLLFAALAAFAVGGYVAGRLRVPLGISDLETEFRDGLHGVIAWALAVVLTAVMALGVAAVAAPAVAPSGGAQSAAQSVAGENIIASELDELFRSDRAADDLTYRRAEAARILLKASGHNGVPNPDRRYLTVITANATGLDLDQASERVNRLITASGRAISRARTAAVLQAFFVGVALFVGAAVAWFCATEGGRDRESRSYPGFAWHRPRR
jgi:hypothetical protein